MTKLKRFEEVYPKLRKGKHREYSAPQCMAIAFVALFGWRIWSLIDDDGTNTSASSGYTNIVDFATPIETGEFSPVVFVCCQKLFGREGNQGQLARSLPRYHYSKEDISVDVQYMNAPCFFQEELRAGDPQERGENWPVYKSFPSDNLQLFRQRIAEVHAQGGIVLAEGNCHGPRAELTNVWLESMMDGYTGVNGTVNQRVLNKFLLQDKKALRRTLVKYGYERFVPKHYSNNHTSDWESSLEFPLVLKREQSEGGVGIYIVNSIEEMNDRMAADDRYEHMGMRHQKSRHRAIGSGWVLEEFLPGATQELIVYIRPRGGSKDGETYFWCGSHGNQRWHDDGNFVKGYANIRGTVTTPKDCHQFPDLLQLISTIMENEEIYGTGCINYKYSKDGMAKIHDWNLRTCGTTSDWNKGAVFLDIMKQIPRRNGSKRLALFGED